MTERRGPVGLKEFYMLNSNAGATSLAIIAGTLYLVF